MRRTNFFFIFLFAVSAVFLPSIKTIHAETFKQCTASCAKLNPGYDGVDGMTGEVNPFNPENIGSNPNKTPAAYNACIGLCKPDVVAPQAAGAAPAPKVLFDPLKGATIAGVIARLIQFLLTTSGSVALLMFVWGGFQYLWSAGDEKKVKNGKETIKNAVIGLAIIFMAYMLVSTVIKALAGA